MADKQGRRLPTWYLDAVNMASEVFADAPQAVDKSRPHVEKDDNSGIGVSAQRIGKMRFDHQQPRHQLQPPPPVQLDVDVVSEGDNGT